MKKLKLGFLPLTKASWMTPALDEIRTGALNELNKLDGCEIVGGGAMIAFEPELMAATELFKEKQVDAVVCFFATFSLGTLVPLIANELKLPVVLWSMPEPPMCGGRLAANSFCAANMNSHFLWKLKIPYFHVHAPVNESAAELGKAAKVIAAAKEIRHTRLGVVGGRVPGFYTSGADEMMLRRELGVEMKFITMLEVVKTAEKLSDEELAPAMARIKGDSRTIDGPDDVELRKSAAFFAAIEKMRDKFLVNAFSLRCWPEVNENELYGIGICSTIGSLINAGIITACEGDAYGAVTMLMQHHLTGEKPFFCDMIVMEGEYGMAWHCGAAPAGLCREGCESRLCKSSIIDGGGKKGLTNEFPLKPGRVTLARLSENRDGTKFRMLIAPGTALETDQELRGNPLRIKFDAGCDKLRETVIGQGFEHHYSLIHGDIAAELGMLCKLMNIDIIEVK